MLKIGLTILGARIFTKNRYDDESIYFFYGISAVVAPLLATGLIVGGWLVNLFEKSYEWTRELTPHLLDRIRTPSKQPVSEIQSETGCLV